MCKDYHLQPSTVIDIDNPILAYDFDMAVNLFGRIIQSRLDQKEEVKNSKGQVIGHKSKYTLERALGIQETRATIRTKEQAELMGFTIIKSKRQKAG